MKNRIFVIAVSLIVGLGVFSFTTKTENEPCKSYIPYKEGIKMVYTNYNPKDKVESSSEVTVKSINEVAGKVTFELHSIIKDKKGEVIMENDMESYCENGIFHFSLDDMMQQLTSAYKDMDVKMTQKEIQLPGTLSEGMKLADGEMNMVISASGMKVMDMTVTVMDRTVEGFETIETTAGTFKCAKITSKIQVDMGFMKRDSYSTDWYALDFGMIRSESYNDKKKLESYTLLTKMDN